ncbi:toprim domain-containing protein [Thermus neutrinimicus]|uniref:toprim domain-containing protein n=3 Tax=Thermus TaxID=270 RepID=UPI00242B7A02|nr:toprim domain-containing protein [Thermus neutrinimicus]
MKSLHDLLLERVDQLVAELLPGARRVGREYRAGSVAGEKGESLALDPATGLWIDHDPSAPEPRQGNLLTLVQAAKGLSPEEARRWALRWLGLPEDSSPERKGKVRRAGGREAGIPTLQNPGAQVPKSPSPQAPEGGDLFAHPRFRDLLLPKGEDGSPLALASEEVLRRQVARFLRTPEAVAYLGARGLDARAARRFYLGLADTETAKAALAYPVIGPDGAPVRRHLYYEIPGLTQGAPGKGWGRGRPASYWALPPFEGPSPRRRLFVCEGAKDGWALWLHLQGQAWAGDLAVVTSTHGSAVPEAWKDPLFWAPWEEVYLGQDADPAGEEMARKVAALAGRPVRRVRVPEGKGKDWTDYFLAGGTPEGFRLLLEAAEVWEEEASGPQVRLPDPVDINRAFVGGHLYVPVRILENRGEEGARYRTVVVRSDGAVLGWGYLPAPPGTPPEDRVLALDDGTIIRRPPKATRDTKGSWSAESINRFLEARRRGRSAMTLAPQDLPRLIVRHLRQVVLPGEDGYVLAALGVMTSYVQAVFDAVPLFLVVGPPGSGKTEFARLMAELGANGVVITGQTSAAAAARVIDETGGLVAFDDLEEVRQRSGSAEASQLEQFLKVSYKKETAVKNWVDTKGMRVFALNFFGVKVITNTQGTGEILGSRMLVIRTARLKDLRGRERAEGLPPEALRELRDNLYVWAMENAAALHDLYRERFAGKGERLDEIAAPLRAIAHHLGDQELVARLEEALRRQEGRLEEAPSDTEVVETALKELVRQGYRAYVALSHVVYEARRLVGDDWGRERTVDIPRWRDPKWVGQIARNYGWASPEKAPRPRLWDKQFRVMRLEPSFVERVVEELLRDRVPLEPPKQPLSFCLETPCTECAYLHYCDIKGDKETWVKRYGEAKLALRKRQLEEEFRAEVGPAWEEIQSELSSREDGEGRER